MSETKVKLDSWIVKFQNQERMVRQRALKEFLEFCENEGNLNADNAVEMFDTVYLYMIKCYSDKYETCRNLSCSIISELLKHLEENDYYLSLLVPVIAKRIGQMDIIEESEEMRLQLLQQLKYIIDKYKDLSRTGTVSASGDGKDRLLKPYNDIVDILKVSLLDTYPAILKECCEVIKLTAVASPSFHYRAEALVEPLVDILKHRHSPVRIAAIEALGIVALNIHTNGECVKRIIKDLSPSVMDSMPFVRRECGRVGCLWLLQLRDRYSFFERILPLVLCCLSDETPEVREEIERKWTEAGELYYMENQTELQNLSLIDKDLPNYPTNIKRPTVGCRALVRKSLKVLDIVLHELEDWKDEVRLHSAKLLRQIVIHSEDYLATKYYDINAVLCKTCEDKELSVAKEALEVAKLIGYFVDQKTWSKYIFAELHLRQQKYGIVRCLKTLYQSSYDEEKFKNLLEATELLLDTGVCHSSYEKFQLELLELIDSLIPGMSGNCDEIEENLYVVTLKSTAVSFDNESVRAAGEKILLKLVEANPAHKDLSALHGMYVKKALTSLDALDKENDEGFEQILILHGIICLCGFQKSFIDDLKRIILIALEHCEAEGKIKIFSGIALASLKWNKTISVDNPDENFLILASFINDIIAPHLIWHAGKTAESVRTMATATLCSLAQGISESHTQKLLPSLMVLLISLIDDNHVGTRSYTLKLLLHVGSLKYEHLKLLAPAILSRLDDPGVEVRERAAKCLGKMELNADELEDDDVVNMWKQLVKQVLATMMLHMESPELNLREFLADSIRQLAKRNPQIYQEAVNEATITADLQKLFL